MTKTAREIELLKTDIQAWLESHELADDTGWRDVDMQYGDRPKNFKHPHYLVLWFEGALHNVLWPLPDHPDHAWQCERREELEALVNRHGCWFDFEDYCTLCIMDKDARTAAKDIAHEARL
jgi:hypothetical protein